MTVDSNHPQMDERGISADVAQAQTGPEDLLDATPETAFDQRIRGRKSVVREYAEAIIIAVLLAFAIRVFVVQAFKIPSGSMIPTLEIGDHILVSKLSYGLQWPRDCTFKLSFPPVTCHRSETVVEFGAPQRGDVIVFRYPRDEEKDFIKRVVGLPGERIEIRDKVVYVNGTVMDDHAYTQRIDPTLPIDRAINQRDNFGPVTVPDDSYLVLGDNRDHSMDSRYWGYVAREKIKGKAFRIYWSWSGTGSWAEWVRWERLGKAIE